MPSKAMRRLCLTVLAASWAAACGDGGGTQPTQPNRPPVVSGSIPAQNVMAGSFVTVSAASAFSDPDGDALTYAATSSNAGVASVSLSGDTVTITGVSAGTATLTVTATDPGGLSARTTVPLTVAKPDRDALMALYRSADGPNWTNAGNWGTDWPVNAWHGVTADSAGRVTRLFLQDNNLTGAIPAELGSLANLGGLVLDQNSLTGTIPAELGNLASLTHLHLGENSLTGTIPPQLGSLAGLRDLYLDRNNLTGTIPAELGNLASLWRLILDRNNLTGTIPAELGNLASLRQLSLVSNSLSGAIPPELGSLANLSRLYLHNNDLTGELPSELGSLAVGRLYLHNNNLTGELPASFLNLELDDFWWDSNAGLCAPATAAFQTWLGGISNHRPGPYCVTQLTDHSDRDGGDEVYVPGSAARSRAMAAATSR